MNFFINYYLNVSLIGLSTKNDRCQDVTRFNWRFLPGSWEFRDDENLSFSFPSMLLRSPRNLRIDKSVFLDSCWNLVLRVSIDRTLRQNSTKNREDRPDKNTKEITKFTKENFNFYSMVAHPCSLPRFLRCRHDILRDLRYSHHFLISPIACSRPSANHRLSR